MLAFAEGPAARQTIGTSRTHERHPGPHRYGSAVAALGRARSRVGAAGERATDVIGRAGAARTARNRDADDGGAQLLSARAHIPGAAPDPARGPQARQHRLAILPLLHEQQAIPPGRAAAAAPAGVGADPRRIHADAVRERRRPHHRGTRRRTAAPIARGQLRGLGRDDRDPYPRVSDPRATGGPGGLAPPCGPGCCGRPQPPRRAARRSPRRRDSRACNLPSPGLLARPPT